MRRPADPRARSRRVVWISAAGALAAATLLGVVLSLVSGDRPERAARAHAVAGSEAPVAATARLAAIAPPAPVAEIPMPPWRRFAVPTQMSDRPMIAIVIDDAGLDMRRTARAMAFAGPLTFAFLPYARDLEAQVGRARKAGHEVLVHVPMEPLDSGHDPGPKALRSDLRAEELTARLDWSLGRLSGYVGANNHMGSRFTADRAAMRAVLGVLGARGLMFLDSRTSGASVGAEVAAELGLPHAVRDVFLDDDADPEAIRAALVRTEAIALAQGHAIAIGHPHDATLDTLEAWLATADGFMRVGVSAIAARTFGATAKR